MSNMPDRVFTPNVIQRSSLALSLAPIATYLPVASTSSAPSTRPYRYSPALLGYLQQVCPTRNSYLPGDRIVGGRHALRANNFSEEENVVKVLLESHGTSSYGGALVMRLWSVVRR